MIQAFQTLLLSIPDSVAERESLDGFRDTLLITIGDFVTNGS
jgi:hypothetical protein